jgi:DHA2 family multidrug resistance protein
MAMGRLRKEEIGNATGIYNLMRNIGGSVGISTVTTMLVRGSQTHQNLLAANPRRAPAGR